MSQIRDGSRASFNGLRYVLENDTGLVQYRTPTITGITPKIFTDVQTTNATGAYTFAIPSGYFTGIGYAAATAVRDTNNPSLAAFAMVRTYTLTSVTVQVFESKLTGVLLGGTIEGLELATGAVTVQLFVIGA